MHSTLTEEEKKYYSRQMILPGWGVENQLKLKNAKVIVIGAGALGCAALQSLARVGVGRVGIVDDDVVSISNVHRQILFDSFDIEKSKVVVATQKISQINPTIEVVPFCTRIQKENINEILNEFDIIIDATDNFSAKYLLNDYCKSVNKPLVSAGIESFEGQLSVFNYKGGPEYRDIFPSPPQDTGDCQSIGVSAPLPQIIGALQANEAIKIIRGRGEVLSGILLRYNAYTNEFARFNFGKTLDSDVVQSDNKDSSKRIIAITGTEIVAKRNDFFLIDVRSADEHNKNNIGGINIPLYEIDAWLEKNEVPNNLLTYCNSGMSARQAALLISKSKDVDVYFLDASFNAVMKS